MEKNIFLSLLGLILATLIYRFFNINVYFFYLCLVSGLCFFKDKKRGGLLLIGGLLVLGHIFLGRVAMSLYQPGDRVFVDGQVLDIKSYDSTYKRLLLKDKSSKKFFIGGKDFAGLKRGDFLRGEIEITEINENKNFSMGSLRDYYLVENIGGSGRALSFQTYEKKPSISTYKNILRDKISQSINENLSKDSASIIEKLVLGTKGALDEDQRENYSKAGLSHLLAISGLHIYILIFCLDYILKKLGLSYNGRFALIMAVLGFYAYILDFSPSVSRALLMYGLKEIFAIVKIKISNISIVFLSLAIILALRPMALFDLGLQLSYLSVLGILILNPKINPKKRDDLYGIFSVYLSVNIMIFPLLIYNFNNFNVFSFISNLIISPVIIVLLVLVYLALILDLVFSLTFVYIIIDQVLGALNFYLDLFLSTFDFYLKVYNPSLSQVFLYYIFLLVLLKKAWHKKIYSYRALVFGVFGLILALNFYDLINPKLIVGFFDVGQGDSAYLSYKDTYIQIDTGGTSFSTYNPGVEVTAKAIEKRGIRKIDLLILSHLDGDHVLGSERLIEDGLVKGLLINPPKEDDDLYLTLEKSGVDIYYPKDNRLVIDSDLSLEFLNAFPSPRLELNDQSLVVLANFKDKKILFTGDISVNTEERLKGSLCRVDILKVSHHGAKSSTSMDFLNETRPKYSVISVGKNNSYGHPTPEVLQRLALVGSKVLRTDREGEIVFKIGDEISYTTAVNPRLDLFAYERLGLFVIIFIECVYYIKKKEDDNELQGF